MGVRRFCGFVAGGAVTQGVVGGVVWWVYQRVGIRSIIFYIYFYLVIFPFVFWFVSCPEIFLSKKMFSCESASNKWQILADAFPCYLGSMLV